MLYDSKIRTFLTVVEEGSFSGAARRLGISQPAVSSSVAALEESLGVQLFSRGQVLALTPGGDAFLGYARRIQQAYDLANRAFDNIFAK